MPELAIKRSIKAMIPFIVLGLATGIFALFRIYRGDLGGWCIMPGILLLVAGLLGLRDNLPRVIIKDNGITVRALGPAEIPWQSIKSAEIQYYPRSGQFIVLERTNGKTDRFYGEVMTLFASQILKIIKERIPAESMAEKRSA